MASVATVPAALMMIPHIGVGHVGGQAGQNAIQDDGHHPDPLAVASDVVVGGRVVDLEVWAAADFDRARAETFDLAVEDGQDWQAVEMGPFVLVVQHVASHEAVGRLVEDGRDYCEAVWEVATLARNQPAWHTLFPATSGVPLAV